MGTKHAANSLRGLAESIAAEHAFALRAQPRDDFEEGAESSGDGDEPTTQVTQSSLGQRSSAKELASTRVTRLDSGSRADACMRVKLTVGSRLKHLQEECKVVCTKCAESSAYYSKFLLLLVYMNRSVQSEEPIKDFDAMLGVAGDEDEIDEEDVPLSQLPAVPRAKSSGKRRLRPFNT